MSQKLPVIPIKLIFTPAHGEYRLRRVSKDRYRFDWIDQPVVEDAWSVRHEFFGLNLDDFEGFVHFTGKFERLLRAGESCAGTEDLEEWRRLFRKLMTLPMSRWPSLEGKFNAYKLNKALGPLGLQFQWQKRAPVAIVAVNETADAIIASIVIDHLQGAKWRQCARSDCQRMFKLGVRPERKYCRPDCAHLEVVRRSRTKTAKAAKKPIKRS
jgi:hypothetical protein